ncbi:MAG: hypothetical protein WBG90_14980 [Saonia sp.]
MKKVSLILGFLIVSACSSTQFVDSWKNKEISKFEPDKLLVVGMTQNLTARKVFEEELKRAFIKRNINAHESTAIFDGTFTYSKKSEEEIDDMKEKLLEDGFDSVIITAVIGVDDKRRYRSAYHMVGYTWYRFGRYYYRFQDVYYTPEYYDDYKIYHVESSIYNIRKEGDKSLVWVGTFNIVDPSNISSTVDDYVEQIIMQLEREKLIG